MNERSLSRGNRSGTLTFVFTLQLNRKISAHTRLFLLSTGRKVFARRIDLLLVIDHMFQPDQPQLLQAYNASSHSKAPVLIHTMPLLSVNEANMPH